MNSSRASLMLHVIVALSFLAAPAASLAQWVEYVYLNFDDLAEPEVIGLDSVYPNGCWQIGEPQKTVLNAPFSAPNVLITDTLVAHPDSGLWYAEFHLPVQTWGEWTQVLFRHQMDITEGEAMGWLEFFDADSASWKRVKEYYPLPQGDIYIAEPGSGVNSDSGLVFTTSTVGWETVEIIFMCNGVFWDPDQERGNEPPLRLRFVFWSTSNAGGRDGWMIDEVELDPEGCPGSIIEHGLTDLTIIPNPASDHVVLERASTDLLLLRLIRSDGALVRQARMIGPRHALELSDLAQGAYLLIASEGALQRSYRVLIQR